jgi:coproporphyrinogen III oxidase
MSACMPGGRRETCAPCLTCSQLHSRFDKHAALQSHMCQQYCNLHGMQQYTQHKNWCKPYSLI